LIKQLKPDNDPQVKLKILTLLSQVFNASSEHSKRESTKEMDEKMVSFVTHVIEGG